MYFVISLDDVIEERHFEEEQDQMPKKYNIAWFSDVKKAKQAVENNTIGVYQDHEGTHNKYIVIEYVPEGNVPIGQLKAWFSYDYESERWYEIEQPAHAYTKFDYFR